MSTEGNILTADFPRAVRGYSQIAVDDFIRQLGERLESMQYKLNEQTARASGLQSALDRANKDLAAYVEKEAAISQSVISIEQRRVAVEEELDLSRQQAALEVQSLRNNANAEVEELLATSRANAANIVTDATAVADHVRSSAETDSQDLISTANATAEETLTNAQRLADEAIGGAKRIADETIQSARREADETMALARAATEHQEDRLRILCEEYEETASRVRSVLEAHLAMLPVPGATLGSLSLTGIAITTSVETAREQAAA
jgi:cell division septum initiation protein DivIVA